MPEPEQNPMTLGELRSQLSAIVDRGRDSKLNDTLLDFTINEAEQWICLELGGNAYWLEREGTITIAAGEETTTVAQNVRDIINIRDEANDRELGYLTADEYSRRIVTSADRRGPPLIWCKFGFVRRENTESPSQSYGQRQIRVSPVPSSDTELQTDEIVEPGQMAADGDVSVLPISMHSGLLRVAAWKHTAFDTSTKNAQMHREQAMAWMATLKRVVNRDIAGNLHIIPGEEHRRWAAASLLPPMRRSQLGLSG